MPGPANSLNITETGFQTFDGVSVFHGRTLTAGAGVTITNGSGVSGNPTISLTGGGVAIDSLTPSSGTSPVVPDSNGNIGLTGSGSLTSVGGTNTLDLQLTGLTNHAVLIGAGTTTITKVGPVASTGAVLMSNGASSDPGFSTATYPAIATGTGKVLIADGTNWVASTPTYPSTAGTSGNVLTSNGTNWTSAAPATNGTVTSVSGTANQVSVATGTTTPVISLVGPYTPATYTAHGVLIGEGTSSIVALAAGSVGQVLRSGGASADPAYSTATYPGTAGTATTVLKSDGTNFVNTSTFKISSADVMTNTSQPSFQAYRNTNTAAVTGDGTAYTVICDTSNWDQASNYNTTTGVFTAPVTGKYLFTVTIYLSAVSASHTAGFLYMTYNGANIFTLNSMSYAAVRDNNNQVRLSGTCHMQMNATDTATCVLQVYNGALAIVVNGGTAPFGTTFSGQLMC